MLGIYASCVASIHRAERLLIIVRGTYLSIVLLTAVPGVLVFATGPDGVGWPNGDAVVSEERYHALRMINGVGEG